MNIEINKDSLANELGINDILTNVNCLENEVGKLMESLTEAKKQFREDNMKLLEENKQLYNEKIETLKNESDRLQREIAELRSSKDAIATEKAALDNECKSLKSNLEQSNAKVESLSQENAGLKVTVSANETTKLQLEDKIQSLNASLTQVKSDSENLSLQVEKHKETINSITKEKSNLETECQSLRAELDKAQDLSATRKELLNRRESDISELCSELKQFQLPEEYITCAKSLSDANKENMKLYMPDNDIFTTFVRLIQEDTAKKFYLNVENRVRERKQEDLNTILKMLRIVFGMYAKWKNVTIIEPSDMSQCGSNECQQIRFEGRESGLLLFGYKDSTGIVKKAIFNA